ncbi:MAG: hypothetical protein KKB62_01495 [Nanoarchaeota archaeon]|nr:hypothetical protein [Nanoarchaeota archaeon]
MEKGNNYSVNNPKISDWLIPVLGFINYTKRNQEGGHVIQIIMQIPSIICWWHI